MLFGFWQFGFNKYMRHRKNKDLKFSRPRKESDRLVRNLLANLILYEKVKTTKSKAVKLKARADKLISLGKKNDLNSFRQLLAFFYSKKPAQKIKEDLRVRFAKRTSGFTRIIPLGARKGDGAMMVIWELVEADKKPNQEKKENSKNVESKVKIKVKTKKK